MSSFDLPARYIRHGLHEHRSPRGITTTSLLSISYSTTPCQCSRHKFSMVCAWEHFTVLPDGRHLPHHRSSRQLWALYRSKPSILPRYVPLAQCKIFCIEAPNLADLLGSSQGACGNASPWGYSPYSTTTTASAPSSESLFGTGPVVDPILPTHNGNAVPHGTRKRGRTAKAVSIILRKQKELLTRYIAVR